MLPSAAALLPLLALLSAAACCSYYDAYLGSKVSDKQFAAYEATAKTYYYCLNKVRACDKSEGRRIDGSCNNLQQPAAGAGHSPYLRLLKSRFTHTGKHGWSVRTAADGSKLPGPREVRTRLLAQGRAPGNVYTQLMLLYFVFGATDVSAMSVLDIVNYLLVHKTCCTAEASKDPMCAGIEVPADDPVHRFSGVRCLNMTWPISFQNIGCRATDTVPEKVSYGTPFFDLSSMYGNDESTAKRQRNGTGGFLNYELTGSGRHWPIAKTSIPSNSTFDGLAGLIGTNFLPGLLHWREHNRLAAELARLNPCWSDDQLFDAARDINIAIYAQILFYELLASVMGKSNLQHAGVLARAAGFRDVYAARVTPQMSVEALAAMRWAHTMQEGTFDLYDVNGTKTGEVAESQLSQAAVRGIIRNYAQGVIRQPTAAIDNIVDPMMANGIPNAMRVSADVTSSDIAKMRLMGLAPYVDYLAYCNKRKVTSWEHLKDYMRPQELEQLRDAYAAVEDVDLMAGLWSESLVPGGHVPHTYHCLVSEQLVRSVVSDRHWFERDTRPHAFTAAQLAQIRKASISRLMCDNADSILKIQRSAFLLISKNNPLTDCANIPKVDISVWKDKTCSKS